jgi:RimJ/RimL family protein N-acetyltransferase
MFHRSERLFLRPAWPEDWEAIYGGIADEGVVRNLARAPWPYEPDHARDFAARPQDPRFPGFLIDLPNGARRRSIGYIGLADRNDQVELGYWLARPWWGRGYATEAGRGVLAIARMLGYRRIAASHFVDNPASGRVLRKLGFRPTGVVRPHHSCGRGEAAPAAEYLLGLGEEDAGQEMRAA